MIEYIEEPHFAHHIEPAIEHVKLTAAQYYTSILSQFTNHKNDKDVHITREDREKWDNKADKVSLYDLEQRIVDKANKKDIPTLVSELKNDVPYLTASTIDAKLDNKGYVTWDEIKNNVSKNLNLDNYLTKIEADGIYAKKSDMTGYITGSTISNYLGDYVKTNSILFRYNGSPVYFGGSISAPINQNTPVDQDDEQQSQEPIVIPYTLPQATSSVLGGIKIGYVPMAGTKVYAVELDNEGRAFVEVPWVAAERIDEEENPHEIPEDIQNQLSTITTQINGILEFIRGQQFIDKVNTIIDQQTGSWQTLVQDLENAKSAIAALSNQITTLSQWEDQQTLKGYISALSTRVEEIGATTSMIASGLRYNETTGEWEVDPDIMAAIIAEVREDSTLISLVADRVDVTGTLNTTDLTINGGNSRFNQDGSGYVANGNVSWDANGNVYIKESVIVGKVKEYTVTPSQSAMLSANDPSDIIIKYIGGVQGMNLLIGLPDPATCEGKIFDIISYQVSGLTATLGFASNYPVYEDSETGIPSSSFLLGHTKVYSNGTRWIMLLNENRIPSNS